MKNIFIRVSAWSMALCLVAQLSAARVEEDEIVVGVGSGFPNHEMMDGYMESAMVYPQSVEDYNLSISSSFLWWNISQEQMLMAYSINDRVEKYLEQKDRYNYAFKTMVGSSIWDIGWMGSVHYMRIQNNSNSTFAAPAEGFLYGAAGWVHPSYIQNDGRTSGLITVTGGTDLAAASVSTSAALLGGMTSKWNLKFNKIDFFLSRPFYLGPNLSLTTYNGLCLSWLQQEVITTAILDIGSDAIIAATTTTGDFSSRSWLVGPAIMSEFKWMLGYGLSLNASLGATIFYQDFNLKVSYTNGAKSAIVSAARTILPADVIDTVSAVADNRVDRRAGPVVEADGVVSAIPAISEKERVINLHCMSAMGLSWGSYLFDDACNVDLSLMYEFNYLFNQNRLRQLLSENRFINTYARRIGAASSPTNTAPNSTAAGALKFHGITLSLRVDF